LFSYISPEQPSFLTSLWLNAFSNLAQLVGDLLEWAEVEIFLGAVHGILRQEVWPANFGNYMGRD
jgi:hypothetical protein